jgi:uncharacterized repeat protein (TIGR03803 family)
MSLVQGTDGNFYGTTPFGGASGVIEGHGVIFKMTPAGALTTVHSFDGSDGTLPYGGLVLGINGDFYGTTAGGGANSTSRCASTITGCGTIFKVTRVGTLTTLYSFDGADGGNPYSGLLQATNGDLYGTTQYGGANGAGTIFKITPAGTLTTLYDFFGAGIAPNSSLILATNGNFYGTAGAGDGILFRITPSGTFTTLHNFDGTDGASPFGGLVQASNGNLYGTAYLGGAYYDGTVFEITPSATFTTLLSFDSTDGALPQSGLVRATNGKLYGTTYAGGLNGLGTIFEVTPAGSLTTLYSFGSGGGFKPAGGLIQATNGRLYGTTSLGGSAGGWGTAFSLDVELGPFVETLPISGKAGASIKILGTDLSGATSVTFNGIDAEFTVTSHSLITTTVPASATTGKVVVTTPRGTLLSNMVFRVTP